MAYFSKETIKDKFKEISNDEYNSMITPENELDQKLNNEEDILGFFWMRYENDNEIKMDGDVFVRVDQDLYSNDRLGVDMYQSQIENKTLPEIIEERKKMEEDREKVRNDMTENDIEKLKKLINKKIDENKDKEE